MNNPISNTLKLLNTQIVKKQLSETMSNPSNILLLVITQIIYFAWYYYSFHNIYTRNETKQIPLKTLLIKYLIYMLPWYLLLLGIFMMVQDYDDTK